MASGFPTSYRTAAFMTFPPLPSPWPSLDVRGDKILPLPGLQTHPPIQEDGLLPRPAPVMKTTFPVILYPAGSIAILHTTVLTSDPIRAKISGLSMPLWLYPVKPGVRHCEREASLGRTSSTVMHMLWPRRFFMYNTMPWPCARGGGCVAA